MLSPLTPAVVREQEAAGYQIVSGQQCGYEMWVGVPSLDGGLLMGWL
jgi:hypothetical protein